MRTAELHVRESSIWATALVGRFGSYPDPYAAVARMRGPEVPRSKIYSLVRRPNAIKTIASHIREALASAYAAECARQKKALEHEIAIARAVGAHSAVVRAAADLGGIALQETETQP